jgi:hypothetical protein
MRRLLGARARLVFRSNVDSFLEEWMKILWAPAEIESGHRFVLRSHRICLCILMRSACASHLSPRCYRLRSVQGGTREHG